MQEKNGDDARLFWSNEFSRHYNDLLRYSLRLTNGNESRALDLLQQVAVRIFQYLPDPASLKSTKFFMLRILKNCWIESRLPVDEVSLDHAFGVIAEHAGIGDHLRLQAKLELVEILDRARQKTEARFPGFNYIYEMWLSGETFREINERLGKRRGYAELRRHWFVDEVRRLLISKSKSTRKPAA